MGRRILIAFDDSENAMRAVETVAETFSPHNRVTLFSVAPDTASLCQMNSPELTPYFKKQQDSFCTLEDKKQLLLQEALETARKRLMDAGFTAENVETKLLKKKDGIARDIISEGRGGYDLIVLGKKGVSGVKDFFLGNIPQKVLYGVKDVSVLCVA